VLNPCGYAVGKLPDLAFLGLSACQAQWGVDLAICQTHCP